MELLTKEFSETLIRIEINGEKLELAIDAHREINNYLSSVEKLKSWGLETILIGSYARRTGIYPGKDVDIFAKLTKLNTTTSPRIVHDTIYDILSEKYGNRVEKQRRSVKVSFDYDSRNIEFSVDVVPAVKHREIWAIPSQDIDLWDLSEATERWVATNPEKLTEITQAINNAIQINGQGAYVPTVKLIKQIRKHWLGENKPGGLFFEIMTYWAFNTGLEGKSFAELVTDVLESIEIQLRNISTAPIIEPALNIQFEPQPEASELSNAVSVIESILKQAQTALSSNKCLAGSIWRKIFGENTRGKCFPIPEGCDEFGKELFPIAAVHSKGPKEAGGFGED